jgi:hypothetical protein
MGDYLNRDFILATKLFLLTHKAPLLSVCLLIEIKSQNRCEGVVTVRNWHPLGTNSWKPLPIRRPD